MSNSFSQHNRLLELTGPNNNNDLTLTHFEGYEGLSSDFCFHLSCLSSNTSISKADWMGNAISATLHSAEQGERIFNGVVSAFKPEGEDYHGERRYNLTIMPWFHTLTLTKNSRIYQHQTVPSIFQMVCKEFNFIDFDTSQLGNTYQPIEYVVQYNESYHHFLQRILAKAGIFYTYTHTNNKHTLVLLDSKSAVPSKSPHFLLTANHTKQHLSQWQAAASNTTDIHYQGQGNILNVVPNKLFELDDDQNNSLGIYYPNHVTHDAKDSTHRGGGDSSEAAQSYVNHFTAFPKEKAYQPTLLPKPDMLGPQSAVVVGPAGKPIYTDNYGRVKVQFHWDRLGQHNENSSCWLRVAQMQAGDSWGSQCIPRVGDEVIVDFINGNADNPVIIGSVHHQDNQPIFPADDCTKVISGLKSALVDGSGLAHELSFDDTPGNEKLTLASAGDYKTTVMNDMTHTISGDETLTLNQDVLTEILEGGYELNASSIEINVGGSQFLMDASAVHFNPAGNLYLLADGVPGTYPIARVGDQHQCPKMTGLIPHQSGPILKGSTTILDGALPVARTGDQIQCVAGSTKVTSLVKNIQANGKNIGHLNAKSDHSGKIIKSASKTFIGPKQGMLPAITPVAVPTQLLKEEDIADIIYDVNKNEYYALSVAQMKQLLSTADPLMTSLVTLNEATNKDVDANNKEAMSAHQKAIVAAKAVVNQHMKPIVNGPSDIKLTEIIHFIGKDPTEKNGKGKYPWVNRKHTYVSTKKVKPHWRSYRIDKDIKANSRIEKIKQFHEKMKDPTTGKISHKKLKAAAAKAMNKPNLSVTMASANVSAAYKTFAKKIGNKHFDASGEAQLFRAAAGGAVSGNFEPKKGKFSFSADGNADLDLAQAQAHVSASIPSTAGFPLKVYLPDNKDVFRLVDLGSVRADFTATVAGFVGASVAAGANLNVSIKPSSKDTTKQVIQFHGSNAPDPTTHYKDKQEKAAANKIGLTTDVNAFAGAKASGDIHSSIKWKNPDIVAKKAKQIHNVTDNKPNDELTSIQKDAKQQLLEDCWTEFAAIDAGGSAALGAGFGLGFSVGYQEGKFYLRAHAEAVCGAGLSGNVGYIVEAKRVYHFVAFVYHKIKDVNFMYLGIFLDKILVDGAERAVNTFKQYTLMLTKYLMDEAFDIEQKTIKHFDEIMAGAEQWWTVIVENIKEVVIHQENADTTAQNIINNSDRLKYTLPEVKGRLLTLLGSAPSPNLDIQTAMLIILAYVQSQGDYQNIVQHLNLDGSKISTAEGRKKLHQLLGYDAKDYVDSIPGFNKDFFVTADEIKAKTFRNTPVKTVLNINAIKKQYYEIDEAQRKDAIYFAT